MGFFDEIKQTAGDLGKKADNTMQVARFNSKIKELEDKLNEKTAAYDALKTKYDVQETAMKKLTEKFTEMNDKLRKVSEIFKS